MTDSVKIAAILCAFGVVASGASAGEGDLQGDPELHPRVRIETTLGDFVLELDAERAPLTVTKFVQYVEDGFYDSTIFHRVVEGGLIQGGAYTVEFEEKTPEGSTAVVDESSNGLRSIRGTVALYRVPDRVQSATGQFFVNVGDNTGLDQKRRDGSAYTVFGRVTQKMETVDKIAKTAVGSHPKYAAGLSPVVPTKPVVIRSARLLSPFSVEKADAVVAARKLKAEQEVEEALRAAQAQLLAKIEEFESKAREAGTQMVTTKSGLRYVDLVEGRGAPPIAEETVSVHYLGTLLDGTEFANTYNMDYPVSKKVSKFIPGVQEGLTTMFEGGKRILLIPPELGFGDRGVPGRVPENANLVFEIELLSIE